MINDYQEYYRRLPAYEDGGKKLPSNIKLPPQFVAGTPEYYKRQAQISGRAEAIQPEAYLTPAGYVKDAVNFVEDLSNGNYGGAAVDALLNVIPWGVGKTLKGLKKKLSKVNGVTGDVSLDSQTGFAPTKKLTAKEKKALTLDAEFNEYLPRQVNANKYDSEISKTIYDAIFPDAKTKSLISDIDNNYGTDYSKAYNKIAYQDMVNRGGYVKWKPLSDDKYGHFNGKTVGEKGMSDDIKDYVVELDLDQYMPGTANHEIGHVADGLAGSTRYTDVEYGNEYLTNAYLRYLADPSNALSETQLRKLGLHGAANKRGYLLNPTEAKSHMLTLKRALKDSGDITEWSSPITEDMVIKYFQKPNSNKMVKNQYDLYKNKQNYIDRLNKLIPMEIITPIGAAGLTGYGLNEKE